MDAMYIEQGIKEESPLSGSNRSSIQNSSSNMENSSLINDPQNMLVPNSENQMIAQPSGVIYEEKLDEPSVTADLEEPSILYMESNQPNDSSSLNGSHEQVFDSSDIFSQEKDDMDEETTINNRSIPNGVDKMAEAPLEVTNSKDEECKLLREEVGICE